MIFGFIPSWELKDKMIFTDKGRKFIGKLKYINKDYIAYYIAKDKQTVYISQVINDIQKNIDYENTIVFMENFKMLSKKNQYFIFGRESTLIVKPSRENLDNMRLFQKIDMYEIIKKIYVSKDILLSNWRKADYMTEDRQYIILMPFIDTEKLHKLNIFYKNNKEINRKIDILTLKENTGKINEILTNRTNIIEIDNLIGGIDIGVDKI